MNITKQFITIHHFSITGFSPKELIDDLEINHPKWATAAERSQHSFEINKKYIEVRNRQINFEIGQKVLVENRNIIRRGKLGQDRNGPWTILDKISTVFYRRMKDEDGEEKVINRSLSQPFGF